MRASFLSRLVAVLALAALAACQGGNPTQPSTGPSIALSATAESFSATAGGADPAPQSVEVSNGGSGTLSGLSADVTWQAGDQGWLSFSLNSLTAPATLEIMPRTGGLSPGSYAATISIRSPVAATSPRTVAVSFTVDAAPTPTIVVSDTGANFTATAGGANPRSVTILVTNGGSGTLSGLAASPRYRTGEPTGWLAVALRGSTAPAALTLSATTGSLAAGTYHAVVYVTATGASNSPRQVEVTLQLYPGTTGPMIALSTTSLSFTAVSGGPVPTRQDVLITNSGGGTLSGIGVDRVYQAGEPVGWLGLALSGSTAPMTLSLDPTPSALAPGTYYATLVVTSSTAANSPQNIAVTFHVIAPLTAPVLQTPRVSGSTVTLTWTFTWPGGLGSSNDGYQVEQSSAPTSGFTQIANPGTPTHPTSYTWSVAGLSAGTYYFRVRAVTTQGLSPYSNVQSAVIASPMTITITNNLASGGSDRIMRFRLASSLTQLTSAANTSAERLSPDSYCGALPGISIGPGQSKTFDVSSFAPNYYVHIGLGRWDNSDGSGGTTCWHKKMWAADANFTLLY
ncbi:MAG TPA: fibronectin type III domain-containing protein, partial [Gemmatimonadales bacterium]|nr:fibronectin type III domain-containing protein [Gemmatimonadales bacterium]